MLYVGTIRLTRENSVHTAGYTIIKHKFIFKSFASR